MFYLINKETMDIICQGESIQEILDFNVDLDFIDDIEDLEIVESTDHVISVSLTIE